MNRIVPLLILILSTCIFALDPIWNMHYTFGPDVRRTANFGIGAGVLSDFNDKLFIPANILGSVTKDLEIGAKVDLSSYDHFDHDQIFIDVGGRYRLSPGRFIEVDGYIGLNHNNGSAIVATYGFEQYIARSFSNFFEFRSGFLDGVTGDDGYVKLAVSMEPTLHFSKAFSTMIEITSSGSVGNIQDDFMIDILPKLELNFGSLRWRLDFDIGIMQEKNNDQKTVALYVMKSF